MIIQSARWVEGVNLDSRRLYHWEITHLVERSLQLTRCLSAWMGRERKRVINNAGGGYWEKWRKTAASLRNQRRCGQRVPIPHFIQNPETKGVCSELLGKEFEHVHPKQGPCKNTKGRYQERVVDISSTLWEVYKTRKNILTLLRKSTAVSHCGCRLGSIVIMLLRNGTVRRVAKTTAKVGVVGSLLCSGFGKTFTKASRRSLTWLTWFCPGRT